MKGDGLSTTDRRALTSVAAQFFVNGAIFASFVPRLPEIRDRIDVDVGTLGTLLAVAGFVGLIGSASVGFLVSRFGSRRVLISGAIALTGALALVGVANGVAVLLVGLAGLATLDVLVDSSMNLQASWISGRRTVPVMNRLHGLWSLGTVLGGLAASRVAGAGVSLQTHLLFVAALMLVVVLFVGRGLLRTDEHTEEPDIGPEDGSDRIAASAVRRRRTRIGLVLLGLAAGCSIAMEMTSSDWAAFRLSDDFGASPGVSGLAYVAFTAGMTGGRFGGDWAISRFGQTAVFRGALAITFVALAVASLAPDRWIVLGAYVFAGVGIATQFPKLYDDAARHPGRAGAGLGALTGGSKIAMLTAPVVVGQLASTDLSVGTAIAVVTLPAAVLFAVLSPRRSEPATGCGSVTR